jgi:lipopolysaccharide/colanic/teichoic acid biosynthesis glycosyltransferase
MAKTKTAANETHSSASTGYKTRFDLTVLALAHLLLFPIWLGLWTAIPAIIWIADRGPVFYRQVRVGKDGRAFEVLKFRTMIKGADRLGPVWTTDGDPRITPVGRILRRTGLDELPEVINIWKGDMSLVGPRALDVEEQRSLEKQIPGFETRLQVKPGLTGLAQIYDHIDDATAKYRYDLDYIRRMSPWLDIMILSRSVWNTVTAKWDQRGGKPAVNDSEDVDPADAP